MHQTMPHQFKPLPSLMIKPVWWLSKCWFKPRFYGLEHLDLQKPALYIGNHTLYGFDSPAFVLGVYQYKKIWLRGLADRFHFYLPLWRHALAQFGAFEGNRQAVAWLMQQGKHILIYPGGSREVLKNKGEAYQLMWKQRIGFIDLAIEHGYDIIPFAALGGEETLDIIFDSNDFNHSWLGRLAQKSGFSRKFLRNGEFFFPLVQGYKGIPFLPKPQVLSYQFMPRLSVQHQNLKFSHEEKMALRNHIQQQINQGLTLLREQHNQLN
ncbi:lysophospholipid acyltransferase family protein [Alkanindiges sp. WGS2144]|uniref:lysophospholipid acyltransferase family protein n=1 Tax=Alkanindiges sp. WGS2144 TaxID=3366808 RepID=UPI003752BB47